MTRMLLAILLCSTTAPAWAVPQATAADTDSASTDGAIIVTAQKRAERQFDVPITISATTGQRLHDLGVSDLDEVAFFVPGLNIQEQSANNPGIVIRGITSDSGSSQQAARVTLYYNGVDISRSRGAYQDLYDIDRIEVVKGPQATLFGTASTVGAISIISNRPKPGLSGELTGGLGNYNQRLLAGHLNAGDDVLAGRVAFAFKKRDGYVRNLAPGQDDLNGQDQFGARGSLRYRPTSDLTADLIVTYDRQRNPGTAFVSRALPTPAGPGNPFGVAYLGGSPLSAQVLGGPKLGLRRDVWDVNFTVAWQLSSQWALTMINAYRDFNSNEVFDADGSAAWYLEFAEDARGRQFNHETRFSYVGEHVRGSVGFNWFHEQNLQRVPFSSEEGTFLQCAGRIVAGIPCIAPDGTVTAAQVTAIRSGGRIAQQPYQSVFENQGLNDQYSVFADATYSPVHAIELTAGVRVLIEKRRSGYVATVPRSVLTGGASLIPGQVDTRGQTFRAEDSFAALLPRFNALVRLDDHVNVYATVSRGRRSPVVQLSASSTPAGPVANLQPVAAEGVWNYEAGIKTQSRLFTGSLAGFIQKYSNFQVSVTSSSGLTTTQSAGTATIKGIEAEAELRPIKGVTGFGNIAYIDAGIDNRADIAPSFRGARFRLQPEVQASAGLILEAPVGSCARVFASPTVTYRSGMFFEIPNSAAVYQGPVTLANIRAGVGFGGSDGRAVEVSGFARNLFNERYLLDAGNTGGAFGIPTYIPAEPRLYGAQVSLRF